MRLLGRIILVVIALCVAIVAGAVALAVIAFADPVFRDLTETGFAAVFDLLFHFDEPGDAIGLLLRLWTILVTVVALPPTLAALIGEIVRLRSYVWYGGVTALITALLPWLSRGGAGQATYAELRITLGLFLTGAASGLVYWCLAGRGAGAGAASPPEIAGNAVPEEPIPQPIPPRR